MIETELTRQLAFVIAHRQLDEATVLGQAVREGIHALYRDALIEAYLHDQITRADILKEIGADELEEIEYQRDAFKKDITWGIANA